MSPHETAAAAIHAALVARLDGDGMPRVTREIDLPERCPPEGLVNVRFEDPVEIGRQLGVVARDWQRNATLEIVVQDAAPAARIARYEAILAAIGPLHGASTVANLVQWLDMGPPTETETVPVEGASTIRAGVVEITAYYRSGANPMMEADQ